jgi:Family of unknown function (DUF5317)
VAVTFGIPAGLLVGFLLGGRIDGLARLRFRWAWLALAGLAAQVFLFSGSVDWLIGSAGPVLYVGSTVLVLAVVVGNLRIPGLWLVALGAVSNLAAILANGGYMPSTPEAYAAAGLEADASFSNSILVSHPRLAPLTDIFAIPEAWPMSNVFSVGDVLICLGVAATIALAMRSARTDPDPTAPDAVRAGNSPD